MQWWWLGPALASAPADLVGDPAAAAAHDYCAWRFEGGDAEGPELPATEDAPTSVEVSVALVELGTMTALAARSPGACRRSFQSAARADARAYRRIRGKLTSRHAPVDDPSLAAVQDQIGDLWADDQAARRVYIQSQTDEETGPKRWARQLAASRAALADTRSTQEMRALVSVHGWIDANRFGLGTSRHAWLLVQHADRDPAFQAEVLERMAPLLETGGVRPQDYAYLWDRVAVNHGACSATARSRSGSATTPVSWPWHPSRSPPPSTRGALRWAWAPWPTTWPR